MGRISFFNKVTRAMIQECKTEGYKNTTICFPLNTTHGKSTLSIEFIRENDYNDDTTPFSIEIYITDSKGYAFDSVYCSVDMREKELEYMLGMYKVR